MVVVLGVAMSASMGVVDMFTPYLPRRTRWRQALCTDDPGNKKQPQGPDGLRKQADVCPVRRWY